MASISGRAVLVETRSDDTLLVLTTPKYDSGDGGRTVVVQVDLYTGMLVHALGPEGSVFAKQAEAWDVVESVFKGVRSRTDAMVLLGYIVVGNAAHVLLATAATATASLHGDHDIWTVSESAWMTVALKKLAHLSAVEEQRLRWMKELVVSHSFYYCESLDLTRPFPSVAAVHEPAPEFVANRFLRSTIDECGLGQFCPMLLSGVAQESIFSTRVGILHMTLISRRVCSNVGSHHFASGLEEAGHLCGNEHELELILSRKLAPTSGDNSDTINSYVVKVSSIVWRQGTPPVFIGLGIAQQGQPQPIYIKKREDGHRSDKYFAHLFERFQYGSILVYDLNRNQPGELEVTEVLTSVVQHAQQQMDINVHYVNYDWEAFHKMMGMVECVNGLLALAESSAIAAGVNQSQRHSTCTIDLTPLIGDVNGPVSFHNCPSGHYATITSHRPQAGVVRFSSIESLILQADAAFFVALLSVPDMVTNLDMTLDDLTAKTRPRTASAVAVASVSGDNPFPASDSLPSPTTGVDHLAAFMHSRTGSFNASSKIIPSRTPAPSFTVSTSPSFNSGGRAQTNLVALEKMPNLPNLEAAIGPVFLMSLAEMLTLASSLMEYTYGPGICERLCVTTSGMDSEIHARYLQGPRINASLLNAWHGSLLCAPGTNPIRAYEELRQTATDIFFGQNLESHLPSLKYHAGAPWIKAEHKRKHQHPSPNDTKTNGVANGISSSSHHHASSSSFDKVSSFSSSSAKTDKTLSLRKPPALPLSSAGMFNSATDIVSNNQPSHVWRLTGSTASILPLMWTLDGGLMAPPVRSVVSTQSQQQQEVTTPAPAPVTKAQQPQKFVPSHSRSHSVAISALPAAVEETSHPLQAVQQPEPQTSKHSDEDSATETSSDGTPADEVDVASKPPLVPRQRPSIVHVSSTAGVLLSKDKPKPRVASGNDAVQPAIGQPSAESANTTSFVAPFFFRRASGHGDKKDFRQNRSSVAFDFSSFNPFSSSTSSSNVPQASGANDVAVNERQLDTIRKSSDSSPPAHGLQPKPLSIREDVSPMSRRQSIDPPKLSDPRVSESSSETLIPHLASNILVTLSQQLQPLLGHESATHGVTKLDVSKSSDPQLWISPIGESVVDVVVSLSELAHVSSVVLTVQYDTTELAWPRSFDLSVGRYVNQMHVVLQEQILPVASQGTRLEYMLERNQVDPFIPVYTDLYNFYADEGAPPEPVRFVKLTFYRCADADLLNLGPIEIFGLPSYLSGTAPSSTKLSSSLDALMPPSASAQPVDSGVTSLVNMFDCSKSLPSLFAGQENSVASTLNGSTSTDGSSPSVSAGEASLDARLDQYWELVHAQLNLQRPLTFLDALALDEARLKRGIQVNARNERLLENGLRLDYFDPNRFVYPRDERLIIAAANMAKTSCSDPECVSRSTKLVVSTWQQCRSCFNTFCEACMSTTEIRIVEYCWRTPQTVCRRCYTTLAKQESLILEIRALRADQSQLFLSPTFTSALLNKAKTDEAIAYDVRNAILELRASDTGLVPLHPSRLALAKPVPASGVPAETILVQSTAICPLNLFWSTSSRASSVDLTFVVTPACALAGVVLWVDPTGYSRDDVPEISILVDKGDGVLEYAGVWDLAQELVQGVIDPHKRLLWTLPSLQPKFARSVVFRIKPSPTASSQASPFEYHLGRLQLLESKQVEIIQTPPPPVSRLNSGTATVSRSFIKLLHSRHRQGKLICDLSVDPFRMHGFSVVCKHKEGRPQSQVRDIRITIATLSVRGDLVQENQLGVFSLPLVPANTLLYFDKAVDVRGNVVTLECLTNFGDREICPLSNFQLY